MANGENNDILSNFTSPEKMKKYFQENIDIFPDFIDGVNTIGQGFIDAATQAENFKEAYQKVVGAIKEATGATDAQIESFEVGGATLAAYTVQLGAIERGLGKLSPAAARTLRDQREAAESFNRVTGFAGQYNELIQDTTFRNLEFGLSGREVGSVYSDLTKVFTDFTKDGISPTENSLTEAAIALKAVGIDSQTTAQTFQILRKGLNQTDGSIVRSTLGLENFAEELGVTSQEMFTTFNTQMPSMIMFGSEAERVFRQTAAAAKSTGLEFSKFQEVFNLTDTFEGSTQAVGQLNALLGGPFLNSVELTMAETPVERMQMLSQAFEDAGVSVESLSRRQIQAFVAATPGINNALELTQLLGGGFEDLADTTDAAAKSQTELAAEAARGRGLRENQEIIQAVAFSVDGIAQRFDEINNNGFTIAIESAGELRDAIAESMQPITDLASNAIKEFEETVMGTLSAENLDKLERDAIARRDRRLAAQQGESAGQPVYRFQIFLDGKEIDARVAALDAP